MDGPDLVSITMMVITMMMAVITMMTIIKLVLTNLAPYSSLGRSSPEVFGLGASVMNRTMGWFFDANQRLWSRWWWQCKSFSWTSGLWDYLELDTRAQRWWVVGGSLTVGVTPCFGTVSIKQWSGFRWVELRSFGIGNKSFNFSSTHFWFITNTLLYFTFQGQ